MSEPPVPPPPVTLGEMATWLRTPTYATKEPEASMLTEALASAIEQVEHECGPIVSASRPYTVRPRRDKLVLPITRVMAVSEVRDPDGHVVVPFDVNLAAGIIELPAEPWTSRAWTVVATSRADVASLKLAVKIIASHLFDVNRGKHPGLASYPSGDDTLAPSGVSGFALPRRAVELMTPYRRTGR